MRGRREGKGGVSTGEATKTCLSPRVRRCGHVVLASQVWHFVTFDVFHEECVCAAVVRVKVACLWGKPQKRVFLHVSEDVVMPFCGRRAALCDTPHFKHLTPHSTL